MTDAMPQEIIAELEKHAEKHGRTAQDILHTPAHSTWQDWENGVLLDDEIPYVRVRPSDALAPRLYRAYERALPGGRTETAWAMTTKTEGLLVDGKVPGAHPGTYAVVHAPSGMLLRSAFKSAAAAHAFADACGLVTNWNIGFTELAEHLSNVQPRHWLEALQALAEKLGALEQYAGCTDEELEALEEQW